MPTEKQTQKLPTGRAVKNRKLRVDEVHELNLADLRRAGFFKEPLGTQFTRQFVEPDSFHITTVGFALVKREPNLIIAGVFSPPDWSTTDWELQYPIGLVPTPCGPGQRWWWRCPNFGQNVGCRTPRCQKLYRPTSADTFACFDCHRLTYPSRQHHRSYKKQIMEPLVALIARNAGRGYGELSHSDKVELHEIAYRRDKFGRHRGSKL